MNNYFASNLKFLRNKNNMTQDQLAKKMKKDYSTIGKWESGQRNPIMEDVLKLSDIFCINVQDLIDKDLHNTSKTFDELELLFSRNKNILTDDDKEYIKFIIEKRIKEINKQNGDEHDS